MVSSQELPSKSEVGRETEAFLDFNPPENLFHLTKRKLDDDALANNLCFESRPQFAKRVVDTLHQMAQKYGNKIISSIPKRLEEVVARRGDRSHY